MSQLLAEITQQLGLVYSKEEAKVIAKELLVEPPLSLPLSFVYTGESKELSEEQTNLLTKMLERLLKGEPFQYVLKHEYFAGLCIQVGPGVLIPRPETQDLVAWILQDWQSKKNLNIVDVCTGSGCIAAALAHAFPQAQITAVDLSQQALFYARLNTSSFGSRVQIFEQDVLSPELVFFGQDLMVSNPPYITESEQVDMDDNVKKYEPSMALFVPDDDPLIFYRAIGLLGLRSLKNQGALYVEINTRFGKEVCDLYASQGYVNVELRLDRYDKPRMVKAVKKVHDGK